MRTALERTRRLKEIGREIGRAGMSKRVIDAVAEFDGSYKGAMILAGRLEAVAQMAESDEYWREQVDKGFHLECWE